MKLAILSTNVGSEAVYSRHESESEQIAACLGAVRPDWRFESFKVYEDAYPDNPEEFDGMLITGSPASVNDTYPLIEKFLDYLRDRYAAGMPLFGICFGHQALAKALGGQVALAPTGWSLGTVSVSIRDTAPWMVPPRDMLNLYAVHNEVVVQLPERATVFARTDRIHYAGFFVGNQILTTQHHPEMTRPFIADVVDELSASLDPLVIARARQSLGTKTDSGVFAEWVARFFEGARQKK